MVLSISNYNLYEVKKILANIKKNKVKIIETPHFIKRSMSKNRKKYCKPSIVYKTLKYKQPIDIKDSDDSKFRIKYNHLNSDRYNIIIVILIVNKNEIKLITTHPEGKNE